MFSLVDEFETNRSCVSENQDFIHLNEILIELRDFLNELGYLAFGVKLKNLTQRIYCELEKSVAITFAEGGILCDMIRCDYYLRLGVK